MPPWKGEPPGPFRLVLLSEGRIADSVLFSRYAALLAGRGYDVTLLAQTELVPLLSSLPKVERVTDNAAALAGDPRRMIQFPLQSVMGTLHLTPDTVPPQVPYLTAPADRVKVWAEKLAGMDCKVGICWQGEAGGGAARRVRAARRRARRAADRAAYPRRAARHRAGAVRRARSNGRWRRRRSMPRPCSRSPPSSPISTW